MIEKEPDCAFIIFLHGHQVSQSFIKKIKVVNNVMVSVYTNEDMSDAYQKFRNGKLLYAVYRRYDEQDKDNILSGMSFRHIRHLHFCGRIFPAHLRHRKTFISML